MNPKKLLANISREFLKSKNADRYCMKKIVDMTDDEVISNCHRYYEENNLILEWNIHREKAEQEYCYCSYLEQYIDYGFCYDLQMITYGFIKRSALHELKIDKEKCAEHCSKCKFSL